MIRLPGVCIVCRAPVVWTGKSWKNPGQRSGRHICAAERAVCGSWMPVARERCARGPGHVVKAHRTAYAMENQYQAAMGRERMA